MSLVESIFYMMWRGIAIGVLISAPMGPVGILCIQRTLDKGRKAGFYTGIGAALSDLFYCLLTGFGLSFIEEFLERNSSIIQLLGSIVLIAFSVYLFKGNPTRQLKKPSSANISPHKNIIGGFIFTFSNPLILFLIIGLFARFNFLMPEIKFYHYFIGFIFILIGALAWWWIVTFFIDKVRAHFNLRSMWLINRITGSIILIFAIVGIVSAIMDLSDADKAAAKTIYLNPKRGFASLDPELPNSSLPLDCQNRDLSFSAKIKAMPSPPVKAYCSDTKPLKWAVSFENNCGDSLKITLDSGDFNDGLSLAKGIEISASLIKPGGKQNILGKKVFFCGHNLDSYFNCYNIQRISGHWQISAGVYFLKPLLNFDADLDDISSFTLSKNPDVSLSISDAHLNIKDHLLLLDSKSPWQDTETLSEYLSNSYDSMEGYWQILDSSLEESQLKLGGNYKFAMVKSLDGYDLIYLEGAVTRSAIWQTGAVKAHFSPSGIDGIWDVCWTDAEGQKLQHNIKAEKSAINTLSIQFPYQISSIRLQRIVR